MANSRTQLVCVLGLVVCGSCWVSANTVPVLPELTPMAQAPATASSPVQHQKHQSPPHQPRVQHLPQQQKTQETLRTSSPQQSTLSSPSSSVGTPPVLVPLVQPTQLRSSGIPSNNNKNPTAVAVKNAWGLSTRSSDSGPYTSGYGYISSRTLQQPFPAPSQPGVYELMSRGSRQAASLMEGILPTLQSMLGFSEGMNMRSLILGSLFTYGVQNLRIPEGVSRLISTVKYFRKRFTELRDKATAAEKVVAEKKEPETVKEISNKKDEGTLKEAPVKKSSDAPPKAESVPLDVDEDDEESVDAETEADSKSIRKKRNLSPTPDTDLTELAAMVLSAVQSGECMQRSICILGSQVGETNRGRVAFTLLDKLIPESVQGNQYFVTMKKALSNGKRFCDRFHCKLN